jgi:hypothetical protein
LLAYNEADCVNLQPLADLLYCRLVQQCRPEIEPPRFMIAVREPMTPFSKGRAL